MSLARATAVRLLAALMCGALLIQASAALADRRVALVIGNAKYRFAPVLNTPETDADRVTALLKRLDFTVALVKDVDKVGMEKALRQFAEDISGADIALFYFSGHGVHVGDDNYILPISARTDTERSLTLDAFGVLDINKMMRAAGAQVQLLFLDACRNNPFAAGFSSVHVAPSRGLAPTRTGVGSLIAYSAGPGQEASDGGGEVSPFTEGFLQYAATSNLEVRRLLGKVRDFVSSKTDQSQIPWDDSSLIGDVYLVPPRSLPSFPRLTRAHVAADGVSLTGLSRPTSPEGGALRAEIEQPPQAGALSLDGAPLAAGAVFPASGFDRLSYRPSASVRADAFSYKIMDDWGHSELGLVSIETEPGAAPAALPAPKPRLDVSLKALSLIGLGPNLRISERPPTSDVPVALRLVEDPEFGQFRLGDGAIGKDRAFALSDLPRLAFLPPVEAEGKTVSARFVASDGATGEVRLEVQVKVTDCDRLAGDKLDLQGVTAGVYSGHIDNAAALPACELAVKLQPRSGRFVYQLGRVYAGLGRNEEAKSAYRKAADLGHVRALTLLGYLALWVKPLEPAKGVALFEEAKAKGDLFAVHGLGEIYYEGRGVEKDLVKAHALFEKAASEGNAASINSLGVMYQNGQAVEKNLDLARRHFEEAAARGHIYGLDNLGWVYFDGIGAQKDPVRAMYYFRQAADLGHPGSPNNIGLLYERGLGVPKNMTEARRWYEMSVNRGDAQAAVNLANLALNGVGAPPDKARAGYYFARAAAANNRPELVDKARSALAALDTQTKLASLRLLLRDLNLTAPEDPDLMVFARKELTARGVASGSDGLDDLLIAVGNAIFSAHGVRTDLF